MTRPDASVEQLRSQIQETRAALDSDVDRIARRVRVISDWRHTVRASPWLCLGAAMAAGYFLVPRKTSPAAANAGQTGPAAANAGQFSDFTNGRPPATNSDRASSLIKMALGVAFRAAIPVLERQIREALSRTQSKGTPSQVERK